jgi:CheY-like chemotaxis protein
VLVVEDNQADVDLVLDGFAESEVAVDVRAVGDGRAALASLRMRVDGAYRPTDLILLDLNTPPMGGLETLAELKADALLRKIPVIVVTTSKSLREIERCYALGAAAVINKPMRLAEHRSMMRALIEFWLVHVRLLGDAL